MPYVAQLAPNWYELGATLLDEKQEAQLILIQTTHGDDKKKCCLAMFQYWMCTHAEATWHHLVTALRSPGVDLATVAAEIKSEFTGTYVKDIHIVMYVVKLLDVTVIKLAYSVTVRILALNNIILRMYF